MRRTKQGQGEVRDGRIQLGYDAIGGATGDGTADFAAVPSSHPWQFAGVPLTPGTSAVGGLVAIMDQLS